MFNYLRKISLGNWILIAMVLGILTGLFLNFHVEDPFIKNFILMDNVFYLKKCKNTPTSARWG